MTHNDNHVHIHSSSEILGAFLFGFKSRIVSIFLTKIEVRNLRIHPNPTSYRTVYDRVHHADCANANIMLLSIYASGLNRRPVVRDGSPLFASTPTPALHASKEAMRGSMLQVGGRCTAMRESMLEVGAGMTTSRPSFNFELSTQENHNDPSAEHIGTCVRPVLTTSA